MAGRSEESRRNLQKGSQQDQGHNGGTAVVPSRRGSMAPQEGFEPLYQLREDFRRLFDELLPGWPSIWGEGRRNGWGFDVQEDDSNVTVRAEAPGFEPGDFDLQVRGDQLVVRASKKTQTEEKEQGYRQWRQQDLYRSVSLPPGIDANQVDAEYRNGVLTVKLSKTEESKGRRIPIKG